MLDLFGAGGKLRLRTAVDDGDLFRAQALCTARRVHGHVAAADDGDLLRVEHGGAGIFFIRLHQVDAGQKFVGGEDALQIFAGDVHEAGQPRAAADEHRFKAVFAHQLVDREHAADDHVGLYLDAEGDEVVDLFLYDQLGQAEFGDAVHEHAARKVQRLEHGDLIPALGEVARAGEPRRPAADHGDLVAVGLGFDGEIAAVGVVPVRHEPLQPADGDRLALDAAHALLLALRFLRAYPAAHGGQGAGLLDDVVCLFKLPFRHFGDEFGDMDADGAAAHAGLVFAV